MAEPAPKELDAELDPELVSLRRRLPVGPVMAACVLGFAAVMMIRLRHDLAYSRQPATATNLGRLRDAKGPFPENAHVTFAAEIDASAPARLRGLQNTGYRVTPVLGTAGRVWIHETGEAIDVTPPYDGTFTGRLRRLDETAFADGLRAFVAAQPARPRFVFPETLPSTGLPPVDVHGDPLTVGPETPVTVEEAVANLALVTLVKTDTVVDGLTAAHELSRAVSATPRPVTENGTSWTFEVDGDPAAVAAQLKTARLFGARSDPKVIAHRGRAGDLRITAQAVTLADLTVARSSVDHLEILVTQVIPGDAWVLLSGEDPAALWYMPVLYAGLALVALLMVWALSVTLRHLRKHRAHPSV